MKSILLLPLIILFSLNSHAQKSVAKVIAPMERWQLSAEFNSWVEKLSITDNLGATQDSKASYYGFGVGVEKNFHHATWGWGIGGGIASGSAVGGDKSAGLNYFEARVPWMAFRITPRVFYRLGPKVDLGFDLNTYMKNVNWSSGSSGNMTVQSGSKMISGGFIDLRARVSERFEYMQSFGMVYKDETMYWRVGLAYRM
ncbi:hypothetical protein ACLVWU_07130 [Bdellovibrio sp. HCB290]|uniref:hypothetical protein n=1 Tax=Bdellovibrio sp. HCB290 TaxID=3394356 RepID=UPI0039B4A046